MKRVYKITNLDKQVEEYKKNRVVEIFKSIKNPIFTQDLHLTNKKLNLAQFAFKEKTGVVEYVIIGSYSDCLEVLCKIKGGEK